MILLTRQSARLLAAVALTAGTLMASSGVVQADPIAIANASFENPLTPNFNNKPIDNWTYTPSGFLGVFQPGAYGTAYFDVPPPDGDQIGYINSGSIAQQLSSTLQAGSYNLSAFFGQRKDGNVGSGTLELYAGGTVADGDVTGGTLLSSILVNEATIPVGQYQLFSFNYTALLTDPNLNQTLSVRFAQTANGQLDFDNVKLNFTPVPEVSTVLHFSCLVAAGGAGLLRIRRKRV